MLILRKSVKSTQNRLINFFASWNKKAKVVTTSAFTQARSKLLHTAFIELNKEIIVEEFYQEKHLRFCGKRILAIDGSRIRLPNSPEIQDALMKVFEAHSTSWFRSRDLQKALTDSGYPVKKVSDILFAMKKSGKVIQAHKGVYGLNGGKPLEGQEAPSEE